ncbi:hypothetical protein [Undibacterium terreum]|uniref:Uncharacterized protein n=1 Tax=Undibacterium terreum TaxID=1224302 RepID=A0A916UBT8_9BURK|nr:hypothetical protein [Undibacterium terreum]GGC66820.1 hypothetical protein GCM10011396_12320 [Undibacterium terreum]
MKEVYQTGVDLTRRKLFMGDDAATAEPGGKVQAKTLAGQGELPEVVATHKDQVNAELAAPIKDEF